LQSKIFGNDFVFCNGCNDASLVVLHECAEAEDPEFVLIKDSRDGLSSLPSSYRLSRQALLPNTSFFSIYGENPFEIQ
jgi:hypothetical protein